MFECYWWIWAIFIIDFHSSSGTEITFLCKRGSGSIRDQHHGLHHLHYWNSEEINATFCLGDSLKNNFSSLRCLSSMNPMSPVNRDSWQAPGNLCLVSYRNSQGNMLIWTCCMCVGTVMQSWFWKKAWIWRVICSFSASSAGFLDQNPHVSTKLTWSPASVIWVRLSCMCLSMDLTL